ncbi:hypothetical protein [Paraburkholderia megapolitana]|uniref:hypothetical protein n=1 Tax=Paraburkholderia megapolitana TaxID=420953 RepID=UPI0038B8E3D4
MRVLPKRRATWGSAAAIAATSALAFVLGDAITLHSSPAFMSGFAVLIGGAVEYARVQRLRDLDRALQRSRRDVACSVALNGIPVGHVPESDLIEMQIQSLCNPRNFAAQYASVLAFAGRCALIAAVVTPVTLFWGTEALAWFRPRDALTIMHMFTGAGPGADLRPVRDLSESLLPLGARLTFSLATVVCATTVAVRLGFPTGEPLRNAFRAEVSARLRRILKLAPHGEIDIVGPVGITSSPLIDIIR